MIGQSSVGPLNNDGKKRYVGRSAARPGKEPRTSPERLPQLVPEGPVRTPRAVRRQSAASATLQSNVKASPVMANSVRLVAALVAVGVVALVLRIPGLLSSTLLAGNGVEATYAASAEMLAGLHGTSVGEVGALPLTAPWMGIAPADPTGTLPVYVWLLAGVGALGADIELLGRIFSLLFSLAGGLALYVIVRQCAGARAAIYSALIYSVSPVLVLLGTQVAPFSLALLFQALSLVSVFAWTSSRGSSQFRGGWFFVLATAVGILSVLIAPSGLAVILPVTYLALGDARGGGTLLAAWRASPWRIHVLAYTCALLGAALVYGLLHDAAGSALILNGADGGGGAGSIVGSIFNGSNYLTLLGALSGKALTLVGMLLVIAGIAFGARKPAPWVFHYWLVGGGVMSILDSARLARHDDALLPMLLPLCALAGIGASWAGSLPARVRLALVETRREKDSDYAISPHTAWLLDLPEQRLSPEARPQAKPALSKSLAQRSRLLSSRVRQAGLMLAGHLAVLGGVSVIAFSGWNAARAASEMPGSAMTLQRIGQELKANTATGVPIIVAGPYAPQVFQAAGRGGWALGEAEVSLPEVQKLARAGAGYLVTADQEWLGRQKDYVGILTNYAVSRLTRDYILFDLNKKPAETDRLYFLESGHTLQGQFRRYWDDNGGLEKLGYPISEELREPSPIDGVERTVQYFERAVLELHPEFAGTPHEVMLAALGRWVTRDRNFQPVPAFENKPDKIYFPQTGHSLKEAFLRYWLRNGDVRHLGYPISEEMPEILGDGKVYTVQYFERARLEWHPTEAGGPKEVQLGLIGWQAYQQRP
jgi:hypothetical protein